MTIRALLFIAICVFGLSQSLLSQQTAAPPPEARMVSVIVCRYIAVDEAQAMLQKVYEDKNCKIAADARTNSIFVSGSEEAIDRCKRFVEAIDRPAVPAPEPALINLNSDFLKKNFNLISRFSGSSGLEIAMDEETGILMLKGKKGNVDETLGFIERLKTVGDALAKGKDATRPSSMAIRVLWLTNGPKSNEVVSENDPKLQQIIERLAKQGVKGLAVGMQLISRCDQLPNGTGHGSLTGIVEHKDMRQEIAVDARFSQLPGSPSFTGKVDIKVTRTPNVGDASKSMVQVDIIAETNKYYVLSSAPIGNQHSVFVVQLLDDI